MKTMRPSSLRRHGRLLTLAALFLGASAGFGFEKSKTIDYALFREPPIEYRQQAWLSLNLSRATAENMDAQVARLKERDLPGFYLGIGGGSTAGLSPEYLAGANRQPNANGVAYLSEEYFKLYASVIESGLKHGNPPLVFYDEWGYPSGIAGGLLYSKYPQFAAKSLEKVERDLAGPASVTLEIPAGITLGAVRMNLDSRELVDISEKISAGRQLACDVPAGRWKVMAFYLDPKASLGQGNKSGYVDYLDPEAVRAYIALSYQPHYDHLKQYFGSVLKITQYDEPAMHSANGRMWTPRFNEYFERACGYSPMKFYPALWYDIGPPTAAARNALWGFRARLFSESYIKQLDDWCREHGLMFSGHLDQEEIANPVAVNGDLMRAFKFQAVPGIDDIWWWGRTNRGYKIVTSAAFNWDKPAVLAETYAAYRDNMKPEVVYQVAMDQAAMGTNFQVGALPRDKTPASDRFIGRVSYLLQHGRHVADIAILYPIASLQAEFHFGDWANAPQAGASAVGWGREGGLPPTSDYIELGETVFRGLRRDFTFLHPEALAERCAIEGRQLVLNNPINRERYDVLILPGADVISLTTAQKIREFWSAGGTVIATGRLPEKSAELGRDREVREIIDAVFGMPADAPLRAKFERRIDDFLVWFENENAAGGHAFFVPKWKDTLLADLLKRADPVPDVAVQLPPATVHIGRDYAGALTYIHKVKDGRDIYFFANSSREPIDTQVVLRGKKQLARWDPHTGEREPLASTPGEEDGQAITTVPLKLDAIHAVFFMQESVAP
ncbi:MAG TPA: glycosyl hydrolase [Opitutaceae bacterium]|nr:glycosyl hydrolase [Opitutaceae bacterium]